MNPHLALARLRILSSLARRGLRRRVRDRGRRMEAVRLLVGAGNSAAPGWICTDYPELGALRAGHRQQVLGKAQVGYVLAQHVIGRWTKLQPRVFLTNVAARLEPGGHLRVAVLDGLFPSEACIAAVKPGCSGPGADDHKALGDCDSLTAFFRANGWAARPIEWRGKDGVLHRQARSSDDGFVQRSAENDSRNARAGSWNARASS